VGAALSRRLRNDIDNRRGAQRHSRRFTCRAHQSAAAAALEPWVEGGKVHWPEGTKRVAKTGDVLCRLLMGIEVFNFLLGLSEMMNTLSAQDGAKHGNKTAAIAEAFAGAIDLTVALEEPILGWAHRRAHQLAEEAHGAHQRGTGGCRRGRRTWR
jgi:hypothetical protein